MKKIVNISQLLFILLIPIFFYKINFQFFVLNNDNFFYISLILICVVGFLIGIIISKFLELQQNI